MWGLWNNPGLLRAVGRMRPAVRWPKMRLSLPDSVRIWPKPSNRDAFRTNSSLSPPG